MRKGVINLDWLNGEIEKLRNKGANSKTEEKLDFREEKTLLKVLSKCTPIVIDGGNPTVGQWTNATIEEPQLGTIKENAWDTGFIGIREPLYKLVEQDPNEGMFFPKNENVTFTAKEFLSKTCTNNWEDKKFCENTGKCELCKINK